MDTRRKDLPPDLYDAAQMDAENRAYEHSLPAVVEGAMGWMRAMGWPKNQKAGAFYSAALCYPGQPGPVSGDEAWSSGGGSAAGPVRAHVHDPATIAAIRLRGERQMYRDAARRRQEVRP